MDSIWILMGITAIAGVGGTGMGGVLACLFRKDSDKMWCSASCCPNPS